jgi:hypothetical protein
MATLVLEKLVVKDSKDGSSALTAVQHKQTEKLSEGERTSYADYADQVDGMQNVITICLDVQQGVRNVGGSISN